MRVKLPVIIHIATFKYNLVKGMAGMVIADIILLIFMKRSYSVYVIELNRKVFSESYRFRHANPQYNGVLECLYVGMTSTTPKERFVQHKSGYKNKRGIKISSFVVEKYGLYLRPSLYRHLNPMSKKEAAKMEKELALALRRKRYAVWWN